MGKQSRKFMKMPDFVAKKAVKGMFQGKLVIVPGVIPLAIVKIMKLFPTKLKMKILERVFRAYRNSPN
jgi:short-subunit dehydrogenase